MSAGNNGAGVALGLILTLREAYRLLKLKNAQQLRDLVEKGLVKPHPHIPDAFAAEEIVRFARLGLDPPDASGAKLAERHGDLERSEESVAGQSRYRQSPNLVL